MKLSRRLPLSFALVLLVTLGAGFAGLLVAGNALSTFHGDVQQRVADERAAAILQSHFKTQVQEWKNVLLRGSDGAMLEKHWQAFQKEEKAVLDGAVALRALQTDPGLQATLDQFIAQHKKMSVGYRDGLEKFKGAGLEPSVGDMAVRGIDREPAKLLDTAAKDIAEQSAAVAEQAYSDGLRATRASMGFMLLAAVIGVAIGVRLSHAVIKPLTLAVDMATDVAAGDLSRSIQGHQRDETGALLNALSHMQGQLRALVSNVRGNAESVATASAEIATGNSDLAARTEQQASALQETASSMQQLGETVRLNADNAREASTLAGTASEVAVRGGQVVGEVVHTMRGIQEASRKISDIIGVIDGIAFQTNILALNAAVEAARAGEQGRGFAVVAGEVRSLAQRSAEAAREIKSLINTSVERVEQGTALVDQAGSTMDDVVVSIGRVNQIIAEISRASLEQSDGVQQVGMAVQRMDQGTQQNAALVEETSAAAESLRHQARALVDTVGAFKVA
ncbi:MAG: chemotaxis protein [Burkholderiales bacterium PBB6]|nr:MAG: chemotaxis protein [Burkholderiales bacterium PBB6]